LPEIIPMSFPTISPASGRTGLHLIGKITFFLRECTIRF
jgi:hypothetical protein